MHSNRKKEPLEEEGIIKYHFGMNRNELNLNQIRTVQGGARTNETARTGPRMHTVYKIKTLTIPRVSECHHRR